METRRRLDAEAVRKAKAGKPPRTVGLPKEVALSPAAIRAFTNKPWSKEELCGQPCVYESYAKSAAEPFRGRECESEGARA
ncbi:MAG: hypothetical protein AB1295_03000 [Candidatus Micrarchaeota archaeon]